MQFKSVLKTHLSMGFTPRLLSDINTSTYIHFQLKVGMKHQLALSTEMFVHNNSKHGRTTALTKKLDSATEPPVINSLVPNEGWLTGGMRVIVIGERFFDGLQIIFGNYLVWSVEVSSC